MKSNGEALTRHLGETIRTLRLKHRLTLDEVGRQVGLSRGMLSKIENAQSSPSLDTLEKIAKAFGVSVASLFRDYDVPEGGAQLVRGSEAMEVIRRGTNRGHNYKLLAYNRGAAKLFEPFLVEMDDASEVFPTFEHPGTEFIYMLEGVLQYRHGQQSYRLEPGDALTFRGDVPHGPEKLIQLPIRFLAIIYYGSEG